MAVTKREALRTLSFGNQVAEEERNLLASYFVKTQAWDRIISGDVDIVYGQKGSGKSALYVLISDSADILFDRKILLATAENPRGAVAFKDLVTDPPTTEREFVFIWKLYFIALIAQKIREYGVANMASTSLFEILDEQGILPEVRSGLASILTSVRNYIARFFNPKSIEGSAEINPTTGAPVFSGKITFEEPGIVEHGRGFLSVDNLFSLADSALASAGYTVWLLLDRLDVAFDESSDLERNALRALFKSYRDSRSINQIQIKIFLRTDIWTRIAESGFREATHISRDINLKWNKQSLLNLIIRRLLSNKDVVKLYNIDTDLILSSSDKQEKLFEQVFPDQVEPGERQSTTIDWLLRRTSDATSASQPRDIILFLNKLCEVQNQRLERGSPEPLGSALFDRTSFKEALPAVSEYRLTRVLYAEYPHLRNYIERLTEQKTAQNSASLARLWFVDVEKAEVLARQLRDIGFFEERGLREGAVHYWVPFVYRPFLYMSQGRAEELQNARIVDDE